MSLNNYVKKIPTVMDPYGWRYLNEENRLHRTDGPAVEFSDGEQYYFINGDQYEEKNYYQTIKMLEAKAMLGILK